jgi:hypothetical protein
VDSDDEIQLTDEGCCVVIVVCLTGSFVVFDFDAIGVLVLEAYEIGVKLE